MLRANAASRKTEAALWQSDLFWKQVSEFPSSTDKWVAQTQQAEFFFDRLSSFLG